MARFENGMPKTSIFQRRIVSRSKSSHTVPTFLKEHEQSTRNVGMKSPPSPPSPGLAGRSSSSTYMSWWMPLPPLTPTTPHQTSSIGLNDKKESVFQFPSKGPLPYDGHREYSKAMADGIGSVPRLKCEADQEREKHSPVVRTNSSPAALTFLPPIPKGPVCLVAKRELTEDHTTKKIIDSSSPWTRRENEELEKFFLSLEEPSEEDNDYELTLSPTVAEINFFLDKLASGRPYKEENNQMVYEGNENESKFHIFYFLISQKFVASRRRLFTHEYNNTIITKKVNYVFTNRKKR